MGFFLALLLLISSISAPHLVLSDDADALLALKSSIDPLNSLQWQESDVSNVCNWQGVKACLNGGRVSKLVLENLNLTGVLDGEVLNSLDQLRVLSFKRNAIHGQIPNLSSLRNLKSLFLDFNNFSGSFPASISDLHRLKVASLSNNNFHGEIPASLLKLRRLYALYLQNNKFIGEIPPLNQSTLRYFNVSNNLLSGEIPITAALIRFDSSSFSGNLNLCGEQIGRKCRIGFPPEISPVPQPKPKPSHSSNRSRLIKIIAGSVGGAVALLLLLALLLFFACRNRTINTTTAETKNKGIEDHPQPQPPQQRAGAGSDRISPSSGGGGFSWEKEGIGRLVFCGPGAEQMSYSLEDLLKASAETLGRGTLGSTYKAVMETGFIVTVKRLKDARFPRTDEFRAHIEAVGRLRHHNLVPLRAYFQAKEERLLVYDYFPNGSLFSLIHGSKTTSGGKPLHWTSCLKIAEDLATGLLYIHQNGGLTHGNLKSSNVLLGSDFESCLTDYGLSTFRDPDSHNETSATAFFYRAPECRDIHQPPTQQADVYSFGVLILELLTGKTPFQDLVQEHGSDIPKWVKSVREELETESSDEPTSGNEASSDEKLAALLNIAMSCVSINSENRPAMRQVLKMIRDTRADAHVSSNSSDHSPGRWSDTVQSLTREEHLSI